MSNISIIKSQSLASATYAGNNGYGAQLSYYNELSMANISKTYYDGISYVSDVDLDYLNDYLSTTTYVSKNLGDLSLQFEDTSGTFESNHIALGGVNFNNADITSIKVYISNGIDPYTIVSDFDTSNRKYFYNNKPLMILFDAVYSDIVSIRVDLIAGGLQTVPVSLTTLYSGKTLEFPTTPAVGFQKGSWNTDDEVVTSIRQNNAFGASTIRRKGTTEVVTIPVVPYEFMDEEWASFIRKFQRVPTFFSWDLGNFPLDTIYGVFDFQKASFTTSTYSEIKFKVSGVV